MILINLFSFKKKKKKESERKSFFEMLEGVEREAMSGLREGT